MIYIQINGTYPRFLKKKSSSSRPSLVTFVSAMRVYIYLALISTKRKEYAYSFLSL